MGARVSVTATIRLSPSSWWSSLSPCGLLAPRSTLPSAFQPERPWHLGGSLPGHSCGTAPDSHRCSRTDVATVTESPVVRPEAVSAVVLVPEHLAGDAVLGVPERARGAVARTAIRRREPREVGGAVRFELTVVSTRENTT